MASAWSLCTKTTCFLRYSATLLPLPTLARKSSGSNACSFGVINSLRLLHGHSKHVVRHAVHRRVRMEPYVPQRSSGFTKTFIVEGWGDVLLIVLLSSSGVAPQSKPGLRI